MRLRGERNPFKRLLPILGPGLVTGASDDDPSGIGTYAQAGASYGYATLRTTVLMLPMMISIQYISAKIGLVSGRVWAVCCGSTTHARSCIPPCWR